MVVEVNVPGPQTVALDEVCVSRRSFVLGVAGQHTLQAHANSLDALDWAPALLAEEVEADDAVRVDMGVDRYGTVVLFLEDHFGGLCYGVSFARKVCVVENFLPMGYCSLNLKTSLKIWSR